MADEFDIDIDFDDDGGLRTIDPDAGENLRRKLQGEHHVTASRTELQDIQNQMADLTKQRLQAPDPVTQHRIEEALGALAVRLVNAGTANTMYAGVSNADIEENLQTTRKAVEKVKAELPDVLVKFGKDSLMYAEAVKQLNDLMVTQASDYGELSERQVLSSFSTDNSARLENKAAKAAETRVMRERQVRLEEAQIALRNTPVSSLKYPRLVEELRYHSDQLLMPVEASDDYKLFLAEAKPVIQKEMEHQVQQAALHIQPGNETASSTGSSWSDDK